MSMMTKRALVTRDPAGSLGDILTGTGYIKWLEDCAKAEFARADIYDEAATIVANGIKKQGRRWLRGADVHFAARRLTRPLRHAAACHHEAGRALMLAKSLYRMQFADATTERAKAGEFDPTR